MRKHTVLLVVMIMMGLLSGCATTSMMTDAKNGHINVRDIPSLDRGKSVYINVIAGNQGYAEERNILSNNLIAKMKEDGYIVSSSAEEAPQKVEVNITYLKRVDPGARFILGVLAGFAKVNVIVNVSTQEKNGQFWIDTSALDWTGFAGTTEQTVAKVGERIAQVVQGRKIE